MIRYLEGQEKQACRDLWEEAFPEDSKEFDDYYFDEKLADNRILADVAEDGEVQSMIHLNPYTLHVRGQLWQVDYLVGVATRRDRRHQGFMRRLLQRMMADMRAARVPFCFLMPADEAIYRPFGFTYIYRQPRWRLRTSAEGSLERRELLQRQLKEASAWMNGWLAGRYELYAVRDEAYVSRLVDELASEDGTLELLYDRERLVGMISEWGWKEREQRLLYADSSYIEEADAPKPAIMARMIAPEAFVAAVHLRDSVACPEVELLLRLDDPLIPENDGLWKWTLCRETSRLERLEEQSGQADISLSIAELTAWLCGYEVPEGAKEAEMLVEPLQGIFLDEVV